MIKPRSRTSISSATSRSHPPSSHSPRPLISLAPSNQASSSTSSTRFGSTPSRITPVSKHPDPLANFRADAHRPSTRHSSPMPPTTSEDDDMQGIEDITESQWEACPAGRSRNGGSSVSGLGDIQESENEETSWEGEAASKKRKGLNGSDAKSSSSKTRRTRYPLSPSSSPAPASNVQKLPPVPRSRHVEELDVYDVGRDDDRTPLGVKSGRRHGGHGDLSEGEAEHSTKEESEEEAEEGEEEAVDSEPSSPFPDSLITPHPQQAAVEAVQWSPSPMSPRSMARRNRSSSTTGQKRDRASETPPFINDSQVEDGEAGPSSPVSVRSRSTSRRAAVAARARSKRFIVLSDNEDDDYNPFAEEDEDAFTKEYKRQVEQEAGEPEETDGSDEDDDMEGVEETKKRPRVRGDEEEEDYFELSSQQPPLPKPTTSVSRKPVKTTITFNNQAQAGPSRIPWQPQSLPKNANKPSSRVLDLADEYDDLPTNFFDDVDLDEISHSNPSNNSQSGPGPNLNNLFSPPPAKRPQPSHNPTSRTPLNDLPSPNIRPPLPSSRPSYPKTSLLQRLVDVEDVEVQEAEVEEEPVKLGYMPVSQMPARWRDFYMNHWRRGADKSTIINDGDEEEEEEEAPAKAKSKAARATKATRGAAAGGSRTKGGASGGGRTVARRDEPDEEEDDYEGDLGGPGAPTASKSSGRGWYGRGRGRGGARRGGGGRKRGVAKRR